MKLLFYWMKRKQSVEHNKLNWVHTDTKSGAINKRGMKTKRNCDSERVVWRTKWKNSSVDCWNRDINMKVKQKLMVDTEDCNRIESKLRSIRSKFLARSANHILDLFWLPPTTVNCMEIKLKLFAMNGTKNFPLHTLPPAPTRHCFPFWC